jgi:predicted chitinase
MLTNIQKRNSEILRSALIQKGITNRIMQNAIIVVCWKESGLIPQSERCYKITKKVTPNYLRNIFGRLANQSDAFIINLIQNCEKFFNYVYANRYGNGANDGYKYRGRGFNQITFKSTYTKLGAKLGLDLVNNPDLLNQPKNSGLALAQFYLDAQATGKRVGFFKQYGVKGLNDVKNYEKALAIAFHITAGLGKNTQELFIADATGGWKKVKGNYKAVIGDLEGGASDLVSYGGLIGLGLLGFFLFNPKFNKWIKKLL